ncbi:hypothetical protein F4810DRAFT_30685 [Camillea tinctor]|nr:hypothetical protein F4810DRAFT_30685 [Camillea tinctor]
MSCYTSYCYHIRPNGSRIPLDHDRDTVPGKTFYYCSIHRVYHCIQQKAYQHHQRRQQPLCGECAWLFFRLPQEAESRPASDIPAYDISTMTGVPVSHGQTRSSSNPQDEMNQVDGDYSPGRRHPPEVYGSVDSSNASFEAALEEINALISGRLTVSSPPAPAASHMPGSSSSGSTQPSDSTSVPSRSTRRSSSASAVAATARPDPEGDVTMADPTPSQGEKKEPAIADGHCRGKIVRVPIRDRKSVLSFIPYSDPALFDVRPLGFHPKFPELFMFRYTDWAGRPAVQPTSDRAAIRYYLAPLDGHAFPFSYGPAAATRTDGVNNENRGNRHGRRGRGRKTDSLLRHARWWSCWAQGFQYLEPELRWLLTLVFDLTNVMTARQRIAGYGAEDPVFWRARHFLHDLLGVAEDLAELYGIPNLDVPKLDWFAEK